VTSCPPIGIGCYRLSPIGTLSASPKRPELARSANCSARGKLHLQGSVALRQAQAPERSRGRRQALGPQPSAVSAIPAQFPSISASPASQLFACPSESRPLHEAECDDVAISDRLSPIGTSSSHAANQTHVSVPLRCAGATEWHPYNGLAGRHPTNSRRMGRHRCVAPATKRGRGEPAPLSSGSADKVSPPTAGGDPPARDALRRWPRARRIRTGTSP